MVQEFKKQTKKQTNKQTDRLKNRFKTKCYRFSKMVWMFWSSPILNSESSHVNRTTF